MGVLELIPYVGPFLGGVLVALFSLPGGLARTLWALGVVIVVQQLEGGMLSPSCERRHPSAPCGGGPVCDAGRHSGRHRRNPAVGTAAFVRSGRTRVIGLRPGGKQGPALA